MRNRIRGVLAHVEEQPVASLGDSLADGDLPSGREKLTEKRAVLDHELGRVGDVTARDHLNVHRRLRMDVSERKDLLRAVNHVGRGVSGDDSTEYAAASAQSDPARCAPEPFGSGYKCSRLPG